MVALPNPVVHLELHTGDRGGAQAVYGALCGWRTEQIDTAHGSYLALQMGPGVGGGIVECPTRRPLWLPYVAVDDIVVATERARHLGAAVLIDAREGPAGWRSVITSPTAGEIALWQQKR
jgi:uncharacterized protein